MKTETDFRHYFKVFTDGDTDEYFNINELGKELAETKAKECFDAFKNGGSENIRLYEVQEEDDDIISEECIDSIGNFPY